MVDIIIVPNWLHCGELIIVFITHSRHLRYIVLIIENQNEWEHFLKKRFNVWLPNVWKLRIPAVSDDKPDDFNVDKDVDASFA